MKTKYYFLTLLSIFLCTISTKAEIIDGVMYDGTVIIGYNASQIPDTLVIPNFATGGYMKAMKGAPMKCLIIPQTFKISDGLFIQCQNLESVTIGSTDISAKAFWNCTKLKTVNLKSGVETIGSEAFAHCTSLEQVVMPSSVRYMGQKAFANCEQLKVVKIKNKKLLEMVNSSVHMFFANTPYLASQPERPRKPGMSTPNDSRYRVNPKTRTVEY